MLFRSHHWWACFVVAAFCFADPAGVTADDELPNIGSRQQGVDWPHFLGPTQDGKSPETGIQWPPKIVWKRKLSESYDIGSVAAGRYYQYDRFDDESRLSCLNAETGKVLWEFNHPVTYRDLYGYNGGPRCSPLIDGNRVYIYGVAGKLHCLNAATGEVLWKRDLNKEFGVVQNFFGVGSSPIIEDDLLLVMVGGSPEESHDVPPGQLDRVVGDGSGIVAFDKLTGKVQYKITDELASYASLQSATINGRRWAFAFCRGGLVGFAPATGKVDFQFPWRDRKLESVNASMPVVVGNEVLISETYGPGAALLSVAPGGSKEVWADDPRKREKSLQTHWNTPIHHDGYIYGSSGRHTETADLRCVEWKTGKVMWTQEGTTRTSLMYVDGHFINLGEYGNLQLIKANPKEYELVDELILREQTQQPAGLKQPPMLRYPCWAAPILSHGLLYVRGKDQLLCLELIPEN